MDTDIATYVFRPAWYIFPTLNSHLQSEFITIFINDLSLDSYALFISAFISQLYKLYSIPSTPQLVD